MEKKLIQIKSYKNGSVIYEHECENNTMQKTVEHALANSISLNGAWLFNVDFTNLFSLFADFKEMKLVRVYFNKCNLAQADFRQCEFNRVYFASCYLYHADFRNLDLSKTTFYDNNLRSADFRGTSGIHDIPMACPTHGAFIGWKKVLNINLREYDQFLVELLIPEDAQRSSATTEKCRCSHAKVLSITNLKTNESVNQVINYSYDRKTKYKVGEMVYPDSFDTDRWYECSHGIHFFIDKELAINY